MRNSISDVSKTDLLIRDTDRKRFTVVSGCVRYVVAMGFHVLIVLALIGVLVGIKLVSHCKKL
jgi:hypothetical protein